jgi:hypothetical protein
MEDVLDSRDVIARFEEMESEREDLFLELEGAKDGSLGEDATRLAEATAALAEWDELNGEELKALTDFLEELKGNGGDEQWRGDWYPVTLVRESYWRDYAQEYAEDVGDPTMRDAGWPYNCIDWDQAARELRIDYTCSDFDGVTYWYR